MSDAGSTGDNCSNNGDKVPPTPTNSSFSCASPSFARGFAKPTFSAVRPISLPQPRCPSCQQ